MFRAAARITFLLSLSTALCAARSTSSATDNTGIAARAGSIWREHTEKQDKPRDLRSDSVYLFQRFGVRRIPLRSNMAWAVSLSPDGSLVAYGVNRTGDPRLGLPGPDRYEVVVADTSGQELASIRGGVRLAWSPRGNVLAVAIGCDPWLPIPPFDSILVWQPGPEKPFSRHIPASRGKIGWAGPDTILIGASVLGPTNALSRRTGRVSSSWHVGTDVSPNGLYSIYPAYNRVSLGIYDDRTRSDYGDSIVGLLGIRKLGETGPACWVQYQGRRQTLVITVCSSWREPEGQPSSRICRTGLVDVEDLRLLGWRHGRLVGPTADSRRVAIVHGEYVDIMDYEDWTAPPVEADTISDKPFVPRPELITH